MKKIEIKNREISFSKLKRDYLNCISYFHLIIIILFSLGLFIFFSIPFTKTLMDRIFNALNIYILIFVCGTMVLYSLIPPLFARIILPFSIYIIEFIRNLLLLFQGIIDEIITYIIGKNWLERRTLREDKTISKEEQLEQLKKTVGGEEW